VLAYRLATLGQREEFLSILRLEMSDYFERASRLMEMTWDQFVELYRSRGQVFAVFKDDTLAGYYWVEVRREVMHLHGIVVLPQFRGLGLGTQMLRKLASDYPPEVNAIELGVEDRNVRAKSLYEREGFQTVRFLPDLKFTIMQKPLRDRLASPSSEQESADDG